MKKLALALLVSAAVFATAGQTTPTADAVLKPAIAKAKKENKNVMVIFHASWCGWCKRLDAFMAKPEYKPLFEKNYVVVHLDTMENGDKKKLENAGADVLMKDWGGETAGLPFTVFLDSKGGKIGDSMMDTAKGKANIGCPWEPNEVAAFMAVIKKTSKNLKADEAKKLEAGLLAQKAAAGNGG